MEYMIVKCAGACGLFQIVEKRKAAVKQKRIFRCKICGVSQSFQRVFALSHQANSLRPLVQQYNLQYGKEKEKRGREDGGEEEGERWGNGEGESQRCEGEKKIKNSKWNKFIQNEEPSLDSHEAADTNFVTELPDEIEYYTTKKRKREKEEGEEEEDEEIGETERTFTSKNNSRYQRKKPFSNTSSSTSSRSSSSSSSYHPSSSSSYSSSTHPSSKWSNVSSASLSPQTKGISSSFTSITPSSSSSSFLLPSRPLPSSLSSNLSSYCPIQSKSLSSPSPSCPSNSSPSSSSSSLRSTSSSLSSSSIEPKREGATVVSKWNRFLNANNDSHLTPSTPIPCHQQVRDENVFFTLDEEFDVVENVEWDE